MKGAPLLNYNDQKHFEVGDHKSIRYLGFSCTVRYESGASIRFTGVMAAMQTDSVQCLELSMCRNKFEQILFQYYKYCMEVFQI